MASSSSAQEYKIRLPTHMYEIIVCTFVAAPAPPQPRARPVLTSSRALHSPASRDTFSNHSARMGAGASTNEDQDLQIFVAMKTKYEQLKDGDEQAAFDAVKKVYVEKMAELGASIEAVDSAPVDEAAAEGAAEGAPAEAEAAPAEAEAAPAEAEAAVPAEAAAAEAAAAAAE